MMAAWDKAGGDTSPLGARKGDVYPVADGFALDFDGGKMFYTTDTGAKYVYGPVLDKYESLGGRGRQRSGIADHQRGSRSGRTRQPRGDLLRQRQAGDLLDARPRCVRRARRPQRRMGQTRQLGRRAGRPGQRRNLRRRSHLAEVRGGAVSWNRKTKEFTTEPAGAGRSAERPAGSDRSDRGHQHGLARGRWRQRSAGRQAGRPTAHRWRRDRAVLRWREGVFQPGDRRECARERHSGEV